MTIGIFFDFDGTLSPLTVSRDEARVRDDVAEVINTLRSKHLIAVASSKDCSFLLSRAPYFHSYICVNGLEVIVDDYIIHDKALSNMELIKAINELSSCAWKLPNVYVEVKKSVIGLPLGISVDWRGSLRPRGIDSLINQALSKGLHVLAYSNYPFIDIYISRRNKGDAVRLVKSIYKLEKVIYIGDSENDEPAFKVADVSVLVRHEFNRDLNLNTDYEVSFDDLGRWLSSYVAH